MTIPALFCVVLVLGGGTAVRGAESFSIDRDLRRCRAGEGSSSTDMLSSRLPVTVIDLILLVDSITEEADL